VNSILVSSYSLQHRSLPHITMRTQFLCVSKAFNNGNGVPIMRSLEITSAPIPHICTKLVNVKGCWQNFGRAPRIGEHWGPAPRYGGHDRPVGINRRYPKNLGIHDHLQTLPTMWATMPNLMADGQTVRECMCGHPPENLVPRVLPFKVTQGCWN